MKPEKRMYRKLDLSKITFSETIRTIEEGLCEITPIPWSKDVLEGNMKVVVSKRGKR